MNNKNIKLVKKASNNENNINEIYQTIWISTLTQFVENNNDLGVFFWIENIDTNYYLMYYFGEKGRTEKELIITNDEKETIKMLLINDGFKFAKTEKGKSLLMISQKNIVNYTKKHIHTEKTKKK